MSFLAWGMTTQLQESDELSFSSSEEAPAVSSSVEIFADPQEPVIESPCDPDPTSVYQLINRKNEFIMGLNMSREDDKPVMCKEWEETGEYQNTFFQFIPIEENSNLFYIYHMQNDKVLDIQHHSTAKGALLTQKEKNGEPCQKFYLTPSQDGLWCNIGNVASGRYLAPIKVDSNLLVAQKEKTPDESEYDWEVKTFMIRSK